MSLIPYAGFDPDEDNFLGTVLAPLHADEVHSRGFTRLNTARAWQLKNSGLTWAQTGMVLAEEIGRRMPYRADSVYRAANYAEKAVTR